MTQNDMDFRLIEPGWAGEVDEREVAYIRDQLEHDMIMRRVWGFKQNAKRFSTAAIERVSEFGTSKASDNRKLVRKGG